MKLLTTVFTLFVLHHKHLNVLGAGAKFTPNSAADCEEGPPKNINLIFTNGDDGEQIWNGNVTFPFVIDSSAQFVWDFYAWKNDQWEKHGRPFKGKVCSIIEKFAANVWKQIREAAKPPIQESCLVKPGTYSFENFKPDFSGVFLPVEKGKWLGKITISKDKQPMCLSLEFTMS